MEETEKIEVLNKRTARVESDSPCFTDAIQSQMKHP